MADISFYKYLEAAFRYKLFNPEGKKATFATRFNYLNYNLSYERIFYYARRVLPAFYRNSFPNTEEGNLQMAETVLKKLDRHQDVELNRYFNPATVPEENEIIIQEAAKESATAAQAPAAEAPISGGAPPLMPRLPTAGAAITPSSPRTRTVVESTAEQTPTTFQPPKIPSQFVGAGKSLASSTNISLKRGLAKVGSGFSGMLGGIAGGGGRFLGRAALAGSDVLVGISNQVSRGSLIKGPSKKVWVTLIVGFLAISLGAGIISLPEQQQSTAEAGPSPSYTSGGAGILSCPLNNGRISCGSLSSGGYCNHCGVGYEPYTCPAGAGTGRETAIDAVSSDKLVFFPFVSGAIAQWTVDEVGTPIPTSEGGGTAVAASTQVGEKSYRIRIVHIASTNLTKGQQVPSGTLIGQYGPSTSHVHITVQENEEFKPADLYFNLCGK